MDKLLPNLFISSKEPSNSSDPTNVEIQVNTEPNNKNFEPLVNHLSIHTDYENNQEFDYNDEYSYKEEDNNNDADSFLSSIMSDQDDHRLDSANLNEPSLETVNMSKAQLKELIDMTRLAQSQAADAIHRNEKIHQLFIESTNKVGDLLATNQALRMKLSNVDRIEQLSNVDHNYSQNQNQELKVINFEESNQEEELKEENCLNIKYLSTHAYFFIYLFIYLFFAISTDNLFYFILSISREKIPSSHKSKVLSQGNVMEEAENGLLEALNSIINLNIDKISTEYTHSETFGISSALLKVSQDFQIFI